MKAGLGRMTLAVAALVMAPLAMRAGDAVAQGLVSGGKPMRIVVAFAAGGPVDVPARAIAQRLTDALGQQVIVENIPGAGGLIGADAVAKSAPDGHSMLITTSALSIQAASVKKMPFDPLKDLVPVASLVSNMFVLAVNPSVPAKTFTEFLDYARRANPPLNYASGGNGSQHHLTMERLKQRAGIPLVHIPYKGGVPATTATVAGEVSVMMSGTSTAPQIRAGRLRAIAVTGAKRSGLLPDVAAIAEFYPDFEMTQWYGLFAPAGTPETVLARLRAEVARALASSDVKEKFHGAGGIDAWITTPQEFSAAIRADDAKYSKLVKDIGARVD